MDIPIFNFSELFCGGHFEDGQTDRSSHCFYVIIDSYFIDSKL